MMVSNSANVSIIEQNIRRDSRGLVTYQQSNNIAGGIFSMAYSLTGDDNLGTFTFNRTVSPSAASLNLGSLGARWGTLYSVNAVNVSDRTLKDNIKPIKLGLDFVNKLKPVQYNFKNESEEKIHCGLIAQDIEEILEEYDSNNFELVNKPKEEKDVYGLCYNELIPMLIKSIQELSAQNKLLEQRILQLEQLN